MATARHLPSLGCSNAAFYALMPTPQYFTRGENLVADYSRSSRRNIPIAETGSCEAIATRTRATVNTFTATYTPTADCFDIDVSSTFKLHLGCSSILEWTSAKKKSIMGSEEPTQNRTEQE